MNNTEHVLVSPLSEQSAFSEHDTVMVGFGFPPVVEQFSAILSPSKTGNDVPLITGASVGGSENLFLFALFRNFNLIKIVFK